MIINRKNLCLAFLACILAVAGLHAQLAETQTPDDGAQSSTAAPLAPQLQPQSQTDPQPPASQPTATPSSSPRVNSQIEEKQPKRILWVIPNYRAVGTSTQLPPLSPKQKLWLATQDSFDYSSFVLAGIVAGISQAGNSTPEFGGGGTAYGRYLWHTFVDEAVGNYFTEALAPIVTKQDPRYYTLGPHGGNILHRTGYALTRLVITRNDAGHNTFNSSEIAGNLAGAIVSDAYYPRPERTWGQTGQKWGLQLGIDAFFDVAKEFWPDIDRHIFHGRYGSTDP